MKVEDERNHEGGGRKEGEGRKARKVKEGK